MTEPVREVVRLEDLRTHDRQYREHPDEQLEHLERSLRDVGVYRDVVVARDGTILAGHGLVEAARRLGYEELPVRRIDVDPDDPRALRILAGDNELPRFAVTDDRALADLLRELSKADEGLLGTGYDEKMLAGLVHATRPELEIPSLDHAAEWAGAGMPEFEEFASPYRVVVSLESPEERDRFLAEIGVEVVNRKDRETWSVRWPPRPKEDLSSLFFEPGEDAT